MPELKTSDAKKHIPKPVVPSTRPKESAKAIDFGGKTPRPGMIVAYWREEGRYLPAILVEQRTAPGCWGLNILRVGSFWGKPSVNFSATPKLGCWGWLPE